MKIKYLALVLVCGMIVLTCDNGTTSGGDTGGNGSNPGGAWREATISGFDGVIHDFAFGNNTLVAVGGHIGDPLVALSTNNGTSWTVINIESQTESNNNPTAIAFGNGMFITTLISGGIFQSENGTNWTEVDYSYLYIGSFSFSRIFHSDGVFIAGGRGGAIRLLDTSDTWEWVYMWDQFPDRNIQSFAYGSGTFVAVGAQRIAHSIDKGASWTRVTDSILENIDIRSVAYGDGTFIAVGMGGKMVRSTDYGLTWTEITSDTFGASDFTTIAYGSGIFIAGGYDGKMVSSTDNGVTWTTVSNNTFSGSYIQNIYFGNGRFMVTGWAPEGGKIAILTVN